ncbi:Mu-like prophage major head subunit gpT family protein [Burkholderia vietnamiensis]|uniref:Mu-like prophage major head subunit gpT family protein n=1 Tax=Burkholderia vietnamiensis TaxID=60552 RepID=UPI001CF12DC6|nr:Mu-like prophage major head subunit gpT family protein [Burkholderia vietnamiensis]MCA7947856.1 Mu-like prophage major head subunit gpT family protein [Burkholderia vietnamiensis]
MEINRANLRAVFTGFNTVFQQAFDGASSDWQKVAMPVPSTTSQEVYPWLGQTTRFREWIGDRVLQNLTSHDFAIKNKSFENTVSVERTTIEDDTYGVYKPAIAQLGLDAKQHPDELVFGLLKQGATKTCYDGQYFFDTDHPVLQENGQVGSVSNFQAGAGPTWYLLDMTRVVKPIILQQRKPYNFVAMDQETDEVVFSENKLRYGVDARCNVGFALWQLAYASQAELTEDSYEAARQAMTGMKGDNGRPLGIRPSLLVVPPMYEGRGRKILNADANNYGATNIWKGSADLLATPWLA